MAAKKKATAKKASTGTAAGGAKKAPTRGKRKPAPAGSSGLGAAEVGALSDASADGLAQHIVDDGGAALARYKDPLFGKPVVFAVLPLEKVERTAFQRDVSQAHVDKMVDAMKRTGAYLDPVIAVRDADGKYRSPNGGHRLAALERMGAKSVTALVLPDAKLAFKILALNTEKAHALKEKALEAIRMLRALAPFGGAENEFMGELEEPSLVTIGAAYEKRPRLSGSAYSPLTKRIDEFLALPVAEAVKERERRADKLLALDDVVGPIVDELRAKGFDSPGLRNVVLSRIAHLPPRGQRLEGTFDSVFDKAIEKAKAFDASSLKLDAGAMAGASSGGEDEG
jgi:ParB family chromosome partitioning protein